jgi:diacylglycerol kinase (ATP)
VDPILLIAPDALDQWNAQLVRQALSVLRQSTDVMVGSPSNPGELDSLLHRRGGRRVVVAGDDAHLHRVLAALHRRRELAKVEVALIPLGPTSDFALKAGIPLQPARSAALAAHGQARQVDALVDGAGALVVHAVHVGLGSPGRRLRIEADGRLLTDMDRPVKQVRISNTSIAPGAAGSIDAAMTRPHRPDGKGALLDVVVAFAIHPLRRIGRLVTRGPKSTRQRREIAAVRAKQVSVTGPDFWVEADGAFVGREHSRTWRVEPEAIQLVLPAPPSHTS